MHLLPKFGETWRVIEADGFPIAAKIDLQLNDDRAETVARGTGIGVAGFAEALAETGAGPAGGARRSLRNPVGRGGGDAAEHSDRPHPWRRGHGRRVRRRHPPRHHQNGLRAFCRRRTVSAARHPDGRKSGFRLQCRRARPRSGGDRASAEPAGTVRCRSASAVRNASCSSPCIRPPRGPRPMPRMSQRCWARWRRSRIAASSSPASTPIPDTG